MVVTTRSRRGAAASPPQSEELTYAHMASAEPVTGTTEILTAPNAVDRSALHRRSSNTGRGIPGAFTRSPTPQEPQPSSDKLEEDWVSDAVTETAEERIKEVRGNLGNLSPSEVSDDEEGEISTESEPSEAASKPTERLDEPRSARRPTSVGTTFSGYSQKPTGSTGRRNTPTTPSFLAEAEATTRPSARSTTPFQTPRRISRNSPALSMKGALQGPKYFPHVLSVQYGNTHDEPEYEKLEGGSDETLRQSKTRYKRKSEAQQYAEDMAYMRDIIKNNRRLQRFRANLPDVIPNDRTLLEEISEVLPEMVSGDEYEWEYKEPTPEAPRTPSTRERSVKEVSPLSIIDVAPTYIQKGKWVCDEEHDARVEYKQAGPSRQPAKPAREKSRRARPSMGITIDEIRPPAKSPQIAHILTKQQTSARVLQCYRWAVSSRIGCELDT